LDYLILSGTGGELYWIDLTAPNGRPTVLIDPDWGHYPGNWADPPSAPTTYLPGQGNGYVEASGYAVPYQGRLYVAAVPGWFYAFQGTYVAGSPDLSRSQKVASPTSADEGEMVTFTISFAGTGEPTTVTDPLPGQLAYVSSSATCPGTIRREGNTVVYSGTPSAGSSCALEIAVRVNEDGRMAVTNTAAVDNGVTSPQSVSATVVLNGTRIHLPFVIKGVMSMLVLGMLAGHIWLFQP
jgi:uncharacterized repeat protein (TIGR01451 family)